MGSKGPLGTPIRPAQANAPAAVPGTDQIFKVAVGDAPQKGDAEAKVTIVEWSDFQCPFCGRVMPTLEQIEENYGSEVRMGLKEHPPALHSHAQYAGKAR